MIGLTGVLANIIYRLDRINATGLVLLKTLIGTQNLMINGLRGINYA